MDVIVACEFSGVVRDAFIKAGHNAISCDLLDSELPGPHIKDDIRNIDLAQYELMVAHPPCTYLAVSGARWNKYEYRRQLQQEALDFVQYLMDAPVPKIAIENPISVISTKIRKPDQIVQPWWFGHGEVKATCLWLKNLPMLYATNVVKGRVARVHRESPSDTRWMERSRTLEGLAEAMATQWT